MQIITGKEFLKQLRSPFPFSKNSQALDLQTQVQKILSEVQQKGDLALIELEKRWNPNFQGEITVPKAKIKQAYDQAKPEFLNLLEKATHRITAFHQKQMPKTWMETQADGSILGQLVQPISRVGVYVPGGKASYPSSVLMNVLPAKIAKVPSLALVSPAAVNGAPHPNILATAHFLGVEEIYAIGGAQAIAALSFGTPTLPKVEKITGPGNAYVSEAKRQIYGYVGIDSLAGPSEVFIWLKEEKIVQTFGVEVLAADLLAQAEHDPSARTFLLCQNLEILESTKQYLEKIIPTLPRKEILEQSIAHFSFGIGVEKEEEAYACINGIAPEHLQILAPLEQKEKVLRNIKNAGAIFWGMWSPEALGDYLAGPNHVIPTSARAKFSSPLSVADFLKTSSYVEFTEKGFQDLAGSVILFAEEEGLYAHAQSIRCRLPT